MKLTLLDSDTLGDLDLTPLKEFGELSAYPFTKPEETLERSKDAEIIITNKVEFNKETLKQLPKLKLIAITATGMNNVDLEAAKELGIEVKNVSGYSTNSVVQHTFMLALSLIGKLDYYSNYVKSGAWSRSNIFTNLEQPFFEVSGKKWGIIGLGTIGKNVASIATAFGAEVVYYSTNKIPHSNEYQHMELNELLASCDIVSIHAPLNQNTQNLIGKEELSLLKNGAVLINVGRGGIVDEQALAKAIDSKNLLVGLDVTKQEPIEAGSPLLSLKNQENLIITPHIAWGSIEAREKLLKGVVKNIRGFIDE
ncbi:MAG TPA: D-2-hydroxyacid dehydrogenase [Nitratifractor sp.]|jgi:lactate dehydrogenase-like 2-hydroxyacid dehydrogenase|nr:D-2-hydroxyacid dehydrogenase [Nitratifractor sp.]HHD75001.1 D-2-hydroxyacid dehydrogenase [Nitratifractor sp.]